MAANPDKFKIVKQVSTRAIVFALARVPGSARLFVGDSEFKVAEVDLAAAKPAFREIGRHQSYVSGVALAGPALVSGSYDGRLLWWDAAQSKQVRAVEAHRKWVRAVRPSPDGKVIASVADDMVCRLWDAATGKMLHELRGHQEKTPHHFPSMLFTCAFSADGRFLATGDKVGHVVVWETASGKAVKTLEAPGVYTWDPVQRRHSIGGIRSLAFSPDGRLLAVGGIGRIGNIDHLDGKARVEVFDWQKGERVLEHASDKFKGLVNVLQFHPRGDWLLAAGGAGDGFVMFLDVGGKKARAQEKLPMHVHAATLDEKGESLFVVGHGKVLLGELKG